MDDPRQHALRAASTLTSQTPEDTSRSIARLWIHREGILAELQQAAAALDLMAIGRIQSEHFQCSLCEEALEWLPVLSAAFTAWDRTR